MCKLQLFILSYPPPHLSECNSFAGCIFPFGACCGKSARSKWYRNSPFQFLQDVSTNHWSLKMLVSSTFFVVVERKNSLWWKSKDNYFVKQNKKKIRGKLQFSVVGDILTSLYQIVIYRNRLILTLDGLCKYMGRIKCRHSWWPEGNVLLNWKKQTNSFRPRLHLSGSFFPSTSSSSMQYPQLHLCIP